MFFTGHALLHAAQEADGIENSGGFTCAGDLAKLGMHTSIWTTARKPAEEDNLYKFVLLSTYEWFDERLVRICKVSESRVTSWDMCTYCWGVTTQHTNHIFMVIITCSVNIFADVECAIFHHRASTSRRTT